MAIRVSPGVLVQEIDQSLYTQNIATTPVAIVAPFEWGPAYEAMVVGSELDLINTFGKPSTDAFKAAWFYNAADYLSYGNALYGIRFTGTDCKNAVAAGTAVLVKNESHWATVGASLTANKVLARWAGTLGNNLSVVIIDGTVTGYGSTNGVGFKNASYLDRYYTKPATSAFAATTRSDIADVNDEIHVFVIDDLGAITGVPGTILERWGFLSKASDSPDYFVNRINNESAWVWIASPVQGTVDLVGSPWGTAMSAVVVDGFAQLTGAGIVGQSLTLGTLTTSANFTNGDYYNGWDILSNPEGIQTNVAIAGPVTAEVATYVVQNYCEVRGDMVLCVSPSVVVGAGGNLPTDSFVCSAPISVSQIVDISNPSNPATWYSQASASTYMFVDGGWENRYDRYNNRTIQVPLCGNTAGLFAHTDRVAEPWFSPAGFNRGIYKSVSSLVYQPTVADRDALYQYAINPVFNKSGVGAVLFGDKTFTQKPTALDRINVRRLMIYIEQRISTMANFVLFEPNDSILQQQFVLVVTPFLRGIKGARGIIDFKVVCDASNNTPQIVDNNEFVADIFVKPTKSINFVTLRVRVVNQSFNFATSL